MPPWGAVLGEQGVAEVVAYVQQLSGQPADARAGHGGQGAVPADLRRVPRRGRQGQAVLGAPNLTDDVWLYGGDAATLRQTVVNGRNGQMPAWGDKLGEQRVKLLAAYVTKLAEAARASGSRGEYTGRMRWPRLGQDVAIVAWPSFLVASVATMVCFVFSIRCWSVTTTTRRRRSRRA